MFHVDSELHQDHPEGNKIVAPHAELDPNCYVRKCSFNDDATMIVSGDDLGRVVIYERIN